uniref:Uncharacterized protein n=1 Tax=Rhizophagus irregularis (strain DAOM 181602 / DAOM 197198 / MUCL 43194) TaxID=747089 RepID=U9UCB6_RHIID
MFSLLAKDTSGTINKETLVIIECNLLSQTSKLISLNVDDHLENIRNYGKMNLKLDEYLEPTPEFVDEIRRAITSKDPQKLVRITEVYGQFIPTSIILGGRVYYENVEVSAGRVTEDNKEISANVNVTGYANIKGSYAPKSSEKKSNRMNLKYTKIIGGSPPESLDNFNEKSWIKSLDEDFRAWDVIEYQDTISIFQPLPTELRAQVRELVGKKVLYSAYKGIEYLSNVNPLKVELMEAPSEILSIITNKDADCNIFATISEMEPKNKDELFTYSVLRQTNEVPSILVSHIQHNSMRQSYKLKIGWMVIGYPDCIYLDDYQLTNLKVKFEEQDKNSHETKKLLNYKYDPYSSKLPLLGKQYVELPPFTFDVLAIRNFGQRFIDCGVTPLIRASYYYSSHYYYIPNHNCHYPKFISPIYDHNDAIGTIYLRQVDGLIQAKYPRCSKKCQTCKKPSVGTINCTIFDPSTILIISDKGQEHYREVNARIDLNSAPQILIMLEELNYLEESGSAVPTILHELHTLKEPRLVILLISLLPVSKKLLSS